MTDTTHTANARQEIRSFLETWKSALRALDVDAYAACYTDDVRVFDAMSAPQYRSVVAWREMITEWFGWIGTDPDLIVKEEDFLISGDLAVMTAFVCYTDVPEGRTEAQEMWGRQTNVLRRTPDGWRFCHEHSSFPVSDETGKADFNSQP